MLGNSYEWYDHTTSGHQWLDRFFQVTHSITGEVAQLGSVPSTFGLKAVPDWLTRDWTQLCDSLGTLGDSVTHLLLHYLVRSFLQNELPEYTASWSRLTGPISESEFEARLVLPLQELYRGQNYGRIDSAVGVVRFILSRNDRPDALTMLHFVEALVRDILVHMNPARQPHFDGLLLPLSWAQTAAWKYKGVYERCNIERFSDLCSAIQQISQELRFGAPGQWAVNGEQIDSGLVDLLNLRLCWSLSLVVGHMGCFDKDLPLVLETLRKISSDEMPPNSLCRNSTAFGIYHVFSEAKDQRTPLIALTQTFRHESLIIMLQDAYCYHPAKYMTGIQSVSCADPAEFIRKLTQLMSPPSLSALFEDSSDPQRSFQRSEPLNDSVDDEEPRYTAGYLHGYQSSSDDAREGLEYWH